MTRTQAVLVWGAIIGWSVFVLLLVRWWARPGRRHRRPLPPATKKQIARAARANRAELRITPPANDDFDDEDAND